MTFFQALAYFGREASISLIRSWKISLLAIATITVSLFLAGAFFLLGGNLGSVVADWRDESRVVVYLETSAGVDVDTGFAARAFSAPWVDEMRIVPAAEARSRFATSFPGLADLLEGWGEEPLPVSIEIAGDWSRAEPAELAAWLVALRAHPAVSMVDDDRDWLRQLDAVALLLRALGAVLGGVLLLTAVFTIASVIRLTVYLYQDDIAVMRLVGATEFFIRGPFYLEGFFQGLIGGAVAIAGLAAARGLLLQQAGDRLLVTMLAREFLAPGELVAIILFGGVAGLIGATVSLRRERVGGAA